MRKVLRKYPEIFPSEYVTFEHFKSAYALVFSRCLSWGIDSASMVPVADLFNHKSGQKTLMALEAIFDQDEKRKEELDLSDESGGSTSSDDEDPGPFEIEF